MKKFFLTISIVVTLSLSDGFSQNRSISFSEKPWAEIQAVAKKENKLIFLDAFAAWCGPCKWMAANIFTNDTIADYYNKTFVCAKIDMEKGEGITLARQFEVRAYPTLLFIDADGNMVHKKVGAARKIKEYIDLGITAQDPEKCFAATLKKYQAGSLDPAFMMIFLKNLQDAYIPVDEPLKKYIATQKSDDLINRVNWNIIFNFSVDMNSPEFIYLVGHHKEFEQRYTGDSVQSKIYQVYSYELNKISRTRPFSQSNWDNLIETIKKSGLPGANEFVLDAQSKMQQGK
jgi:thiol-disulfide isomerase/thioredoxin